jgi:Tol biopolymer transport system component
MMARGSGRPGRDQSVLGALSVGNVVAGLGLLAIAVLSLSLLTGNLPLRTGGNGGDGGDTGPIRTATPSNIVIVDPRAKVPGTILYVKAGNIWLQHGETATALTSGGHDAMPSFTADGQWIYFIRTADVTGSWRIGGVARRFRLDMPTLMRIKPDGSAQPEALLTGQVKSGSSVWSYFLRQPVVSPDGSTIVVVTEGPDPTKSDVVLKTFDPATGKLTSLNAPESPPLGHQDPAWSPDGRYLMFVKNARDGSRGAPVIMRYDMTTRKAVAITGPGYTSPAWSPDGRFLAATRTTSFGTDIVVLDAVRGTELLRVTTNGSSFDPVWSPAGDAIAYLSLSGGVTDLWSAGVTTSGAPALKGSPLELTIAAGLDAASRPGWWIPANLLPTPVPTAIPTPVPTASAIAPLPSSSP